MLVGAEVEISAQLRIMFVLLAF